MLKKAAVSPRRHPRRGSARLAPKPQKAPDQAVHLVTDDAEPAPAAGDDAGEADSVAEMEAVGDSEDEGDGAAVQESEAEPTPPEPEKARRDDEPSNFLALYFREMARLSVLRPEEEFESARQIEQLEIELWARMLAYSPLADHILKLVERTIDNSLPEFKVVRRAVADYKKKPSRNADEKVQRAALKAAEHLRALDIDKRYLDVTHDEVQRISRGMPTRLVGERVPAVNVKSKIFRGFVREGAELHSRIAFHKNEFVKANLRLVVSIARRFNHGRMPLSDLIQEGNIGLIKAVERYDYRRGYRFSTYASWWIRHAISRALADKGRAVRLPVHMIDAYHRVAKSKRELTSRLGRNPTSEELGQATGIAAAKIEKMRTYLLDQSFSLDRPVSDDDGRKFIDFIVDPNADAAPADKLVDQAMTTEVRSLLDHLKPIEADILRQRFGLDTEKELTLKEIGEKYNLSRERIRQLQEQALLKMRRALQRKDLM
jgi:RNA polymerase primary sigma factor